MSENLSESAKNSVVRHLLGDELSDQDVAGLAIYTLDPDPEHALSCAYECPRCGAFREQKLSQAELDYHLRIGRQKEAEYRANPENVDDPGLAGFAHVWSCGGYRFMFGVSLDTIMEARSPDREEVVVATDIYARSAVPQLLESILPFVLAKIMEDSVEESERDGVFPFPDLNDMLRKQSKGYMN